MAFGRGKHSQHGNKPIQHEHSFTVQGSAVICLDHDRMMRRIYHCASTACSATTEKPEGPCSSHG